MAVPAACWEGAWSPARGGGLAGGALSCSINIVGLEPCLGGSQGPAAKPLVNSPQADLFRWGPKAWDAAEALLLGITSPELESWANFKRKG